MKQWSGFRISLRGKGPAGAQEIRFSNEQVKAPGS